jgi:hypothetical protein
VINVEKRLRLGFDGPPRALLAVAAGQFDTQGAFQFQRIL